MHCYIHVYVPKTEYITCVLGIHVSSEIKKDGQHQVPLSIKLHNTLYMYVHVHMQTEGGGGKEGGREGGGRKKGREGQGRITRE